MSDVQVLESGLLTTIQDAHGRPGLGRYGVAPGGAMDAEAARLANRLVGNDGDAPVLEITMHGPTLRPERAAHFFEEQVDEFACFALVEPELVEERLRYFCLRQRHL